MKSLLVLGTIAAMALTTTVQGQSVRGRNIGSSRVVTRNSAQRATVAPSTTRNVVRSNVGGRHYYRGGRYYGGYSPYYYGGPSVSVGFGGYYGPGYYGYGYPYGYDYAYGYPYNSGYGYVYPSDYYGDYPSRYTTTTTTSRYGDLAYDDNIVIAVQSRLKQRGYYLGAIDGVAGPETRSAIARWEGNHGMSADGRIDERTLRSLGVS
jgi:hypothetical protein